VDDLPPELHLHEGFHVCLQHSGSTFVLVTST
jgi:hypothetical protein